jgi:predicted RecB family endonuclease
MESLFQLAAKHLFKVKFKGGRVMQTIHELNARIDRLKKLFGADKPSPTRVRGIMKQLGDDSLLAIGTVVPPIRQDEEEGRE